MHAKRIVSSLYLYPGQTLAGTLECTLLMGQWKWGQITISCCLMNSGVIKREAMSDRGSGGGLCGSATRQGIPGRRLLRESKPAKGQQVGYLRVSSVDQNEVRQLEGLALVKTFTDKAAGMDARGGLERCVGLPGGW